MTFETILFLIALATAIAASVDMILMRRRVARLESRIEHYKAVLGSHEHDYSAHDHD